MAMKKMTMNDEVDDDDDGRDDEVYKYMTMVSDEEIKSATDLLDFI